MATLETFKKLEYNYILIYLFLLVKNKDYDLYIIICLCNNGNSKLIYGNKFPLHTISFHFRISNYFFIFY